MFRSRYQALSLGCIALALGLVANSLLGPLMTGIIDYRYTETFENQGVGLDAFSLAVAAPLLLVSAWLVWRGHVAGPLLALGPSLMAAYMMPQYILGAHYVAIPGNNEDFFLLHLGLFVLSAAISVLAWNLVIPSQLPATSRTHRRWTGTVVLGVAAFLVMRYLPALIGIWRDDPTGEYLADPIAFWIIAFMDLGIVLPVALAAGIAMLRGTSGASKVMYAVVGWFALVGPAVAAMAFAMEFNDDPNASLAGALSFTVLGAIFLVVAAFIFRPLLPGRHPGNAEG